MNVKDQDLLSGQLCKNINVPSKLREMRKWIMYSYAYMIMIVSIKLPFNGWNNLSSVFIKYYFFNFLYPFFPQLSQCLCIEVCRLILCCLSQTCPHTHTPSPIHYILYIIYAKTSIHYLPLTARQIINDSYSSLPSTALDLWCWCWSIHVCIIKNQYSTLPKTPYITI